MTYAGCNMTVKPELHRAAFSSYAGCRILAAMAEQRTYLAEWRRKRNFTQAQVIERLLEFDDDKIPRTTASLSRIENGEQVYGQRILEALAYIYDCEVWELLGRDPFKEGEVIDLLAHMTPEQQRQATAIVRAFAETQAAYTPPDPPPPDGRLRPRKRG